VLILVPVFFLMMKERASRRVESDRESPDGSAARNSEINGTDKKAQLNI